MAERLRVAVLMGGRSGEHEVSVLSAASVLRAMDRELFEPLPVVISKTGRWLLPEDSSAVLARGMVEEGDGQPVVLVAGEEDGRALLVPLGGRQGGAPQPVDVVFPVLHGPNGEDGTVQGLLELVRVPYVGAGVAASALGMDKGLMKDVFRAKGLPVVDYLVLLRPEWEQAPETVVMRIESELGYPVFVKPANLGSSVGISKVRRREELAPAMDLAAGYDRRLVVEKGVDAREIECSVLGNDAPEASVPGEIVPSREFYDYEAKYVDGRSELLIPAPLAPETARRVRELAVEAFLAIDCAGMARVDFFLERDTGRLLVNEINTLPGFTSISMYPKLWEASGLHYPRLISRLIDLALQRWRQKTRLASVSRERNSLYGGE